MYLIVTLREWVCAFSPTCGRYILVHFATALHSHPTLISDKPYFKPESLGRYTVIEGEAKNISLRYHSHITPEYLWDFWIT